VLYCKQMSSIKMKNLFFNVEITREKYRNISLEITTF
jgi:hypothetical protein